MTKTEYILTILPVLYFLIVGVLYWRISEELNNLKAEVKELHEEGKAADEYIDILADKVSDLEDRVEEDRVLEEVIDSIGEKKINPKN